MYTSYTDISDHEQLQTVVFTSHVFSTREDAQKAIEQEISDDLVILGQRILENPEYADHYNKEAELLKNNKWIFAEDDPRDSEEMPKYEIIEVTVI